MQSLARQASDLEQLNKRVEKQQQQQQQKLMALCRQEFSCQPDALKAVKRFEHQLKFHALDAVEVVEQVHYEQAGRPGKDAQASRVSYHLRACLGQRALRQALVAAGESLRNQLGQATQRPTLRWVFQCFQAVHLLQVAGTKQVSNLCEEPVRNEGEFSAFLSQLVANIIYFAERPAECGLTRLTWRLPLLHSICSHLSATASATRSP